MRTAARLLALLVVLAGVLPVAAVAPAVTAGATQPATTVPQQPQLRDDRSPDPFAGGATDLSVTDPVLDSLGGAPRVGPAQQEAPPVFDDHETEFRVQLYDNGSARWTVETRFPLDSETERAVFSRYATEFERDATSAGYDVALFERVASDASVAAGRSMAIERRTRTAEVDNDTGVLRLQFTWTRFAERGVNDTLLVGDAFRTPDNGSWLATLDPAQTVVLRAPPGYVVSSNPGFVQPNSRTIVIEGPRRFQGPDAQEIAVSYQPSLPGRGGDIPWTLVVGVVGLVALVAIGGTWYLQRVDEDDERSPGAPTIETDGANGSLPEGTGEGTRGTDAIGTADATGPSTAGDEASTAGPTGGGPVEGGERESEGEEPSEADDVDLELLSDEERVEYLLEQNGGRMKQANIVEETGWSDAKVSQLLSSMAEAGRVDKLRLGRENLISLPEDEDGQ